MKKLIIPCLYLDQEKAVAGFGNTDLVSDGNVVSLASYYSDHGADEVLVFDFSVSDDEHEKAIGKIKEICNISEIPVIAAGNVKRMEDIKKLIYAGCAKTVLNFSKASNIALLEEVSKRFGKEKMLVCVARSDEFSNNRELIEAYAAGILCMNDSYREVARQTELPVYVLSDTQDSEELFDTMKLEGVNGISGAYVSNPDLEITSLKVTCKARGIDVNVYESAIAWSEFKLNSDGLIPVIVQDYKTDEVLMMAYMNEEAFNRTIETGKMTYWSRSRSELWVKGLTSGHYQYVKSLSIDCDNDTILAKVAQVGAACHTGNRSCFYKPLMKKEYDDTNPLRVFQNVYDVILDRKINPKEGSYTNYLFEKGIDKILKKVGEECTEIVIAAKNPDKEEIKYEISDFLYHVMVLMAVKDVSWEDITKELARR